MTNCSEYVSVGHPDRTADGIASYLLDEYLKHDPKARFALEVQLKDQICNLAGEVTSTWKPSQSEIANLVREAICKIGYTAEYAARWPEGATLNADKVIVNNFIGQQSPNIAQGVDREGWGDQGCFMGMATNEAEYGYMPRDRFFAHELGKRLYCAAKNNEAPIGLDIKTLVTLSTADVAKQVVVAAPVTPANELSAKSFITKTITSLFEEHGYSVKEIIINGTGAYVIHSSVGDAGVVGRKLAVDFYGLNCPIGGGTTWGKDGTKADVTLNLAARYLSLSSMLESECKHKIIYTKISCCIGKSECYMEQTNEKGELIETGRVDLNPTEWKRRLMLDGISMPNVFSSLCENGLFSVVDSIAEQDFASSL